MLIRATRPMIDSIEIENFRCFERLSVQSCKRFNLIVGDSGVGKTSLLEAMFLALGSSPEIALRLRALRGLDSSFGASSFKIEEALWRNLFYGGNWQDQISVRLNADAEDNREVGVFKVPADISLPFSPSIPSSGTATVAFRYRNSIGQEYTRAPRLSGANFVFDGQDEDLPDHFYVPSGNTSGSVDNATRFSDLSRRGRSQGFVNEFRREFPWVQDLRVEVEAGSPVIHASVVGLQESIPFALTSSGVSKTVSLLLMMASRDRSTILIDEIENGIYYKHLPTLWRALMRYGLKHNSQVFATTHSKECIDAFVEAADESDGNVSLMRFERSDGGRPELFRFEGRDFIEAVNVGAEVRGGLE